MICSDFQKLIISKGINFLSINILIQLPSCFSENFQFIILLALHICSLQAIHFLKSVSIWEQNGYHSLGMHFFISEVKDKISCLFPYCFYLFLILSSKVTSFSLVIKGSRRECMGFKVRVTQGLTCFPIYLCYFGQVTTWSFCLLLCISNCPHKVVTV